jgi:DNA-binding HxlR family transcriptional regulator
MARKRFEDMPCGVAQALEQIGDWWTLLIVRDAFFGVQRFQQFQQSLGISKNILSQRLGQLVDNGILERARLNEPGERYAYTLTPKGKGLWLVLTALRLWSDKWVFGEDRMPLVVRDGTTGKRVAKLVATDEDGQPVDARALRFEAGPGLIDGTWRDALQAPEGQQT